MGLQQDMSSAATNESQIITAQRFVSSKLFTNLFAHGMELVDETATYLDGEGRDASKALSRQGALCYASVSMRLTTKLMQVASWLLVLRAVREGEMSYEEASQDKYRLGSMELKEDLFRGDETVKTQLPEVLVELIDDADQLFSRIARIDKDIFELSDSSDSLTDATSQLKALQAAFPG